MFLSSVTMYFSKYIFFNLVEMAFRKLCRSRTKGLALALIQEEKQLRELGHSHCPLGTDIFLGRLLVEGCVHNEKALLRHNKNY
jgi:hypothetical protein